MDGGAIWSAASVSNTVIVVVVEELHSSVSEIATTPMRLWHLPPNHVDCGVVLCVSCFEMWQSQVARTLQSNRLVFAFERQMSTSAHVVVEN